MKSRSSARGMARSCMNRWGRVKKWRVADDSGDCYRIPADSRDLNYDKFFVEGQPEISTIDDSTSHNTHRLKVAQVKETLMQLDIVCEVVDA